MSESFHVRVAKERFVFSAAHFITYGDNICERLHGHNYGVAVEVEGPLEANQYVIDFIALRDALVEITQTLDHRVLLPESHPTIRVEANDREVTAAFEERRWVFPKEDCVVLPVANTTAELIARYIGQQLLGSLGERGLASPAGMCVSVDECEGQQGMWSFRAG